MGNEGCASLEKVKYIASHIGFRGHETFTITLITAALAGATGAAFFIRILMMVADTGLWRYPLWLALSPVLLPRIFRNQIFRALQKMDEFRRKHSKGTAK